MEIPQIKISDVFVNHGIGQNWLQFSFERIENIPNTIILHVNADNVLYKYIYTGTADEIATVINKDLGLDKFVTA